MDRLHVGRIDIELTVGDIADQPDVDAVVNAANAQLQTGGGVAGAIHRAAGPGLAEECAPLAPIRPGECVISGAHDLPNANVVHCLGPVYGQDEPAEQLLASCYWEALRLAEEHALRSVAFPAISTGAFGYPLREAATTAVDTVAEAAKNLMRVELIRFVLFSPADLEVFADALAEHADGSAPA